MPARHACHIDTGADAFSGSSGAETCRCPPGNRACGTSRSRRMVDHTVVSASCSPANGLRGQMRSARASSRGCCLSLFLTTGMYTHAACEAGRHASASTPITPVDRRGVCLPIETHGRLEVHLRRAVGEKWCRQPPGASRSAAFRFFFSCPSDEQTRHFLRLSGGEGEGVWPRLTAVRGSTRKFGSADSIGSRMVNHLAISAKRQHMARSAWSSSTCLRSAVTKVYRRARFASCV